MKVKFGYAVALASAIALTGCGKKMNQFAADYFSVNPNPLEVVGTRVPAVVTGHIPAGFFVKDAVVTVTPVLVYNGTSAQASSMTFQGEKVRGNNPIVSFASASTVSIPVDYIYTPEMRRSEL